MIETFAAALPHGITQSCRASARPEAPLLVFLRGFLGAAFVREQVPDIFGGRYRCVAPKLRGFSPVVGAAGPVEALMAHDRSGAVAWTLAALKSELL